MEKVKNYLKNIKSKYILEKIIGNISQKKLLYLIKNNKSIQKTLDIGIKDYENYLNIEIDIIPFYKKEKNSFINIKNEYKSHYHIYFKEKRDEIKRTYFTTTNDDVSKIKIRIDKEITSLKDLFLDVNCIEKINFINLIESIL